jgi:hypothetical protein
MRKGERENGRMGEWEKVRSFSKYLIQSVLTNDFFEYIEY